MNKSKLSILACAACFALTLQHATAQAPPGVPEPGLILWGKLTDAGGNAATVPAAALNWIADNGTESFNITGASTPPVQTWSSGGQNFYMVEIPFNTYKVGAAPLSLIGNSFEFPSPAPVTPPSYVFQASANGSAATIKAVNGVASGQPTFTVSDFTVSGTAGRGRVTQVDLTVVSSADPYTAWMNAYLSSSDPRAARTADADGDGQTNEQEFAANTNPLDGTVFLKIVTITRVSATSASISWTSNPGQSYTLEASDTASSNPLGSTPWTTLGTYSGAAAPARTTTVPGVPITAGQRKRFYRVRTTR